MVTDWLAAWAIKDPPPNTLSAPFVFLTMMEPLRLEMVPALFKVVRPALPGGVRLSVRLCADAEVPDTCMLPVLINCGVVTVNPPALVKLPDTCSVLFVPMRL